MKLFAQISFRDGLSIFSEGDENRVRKTEKLNLFPQFSDIVLLKVFVASQKAHHPFRGLLLKVLDDVCHIGAPIARVLESVSYLEVSGHWSGIMEIAEGSFNPSRNIQSEKNRISV